MELLELHQYVNKLKEGSFEGWSEDERLAYLTACISIEKKIEELTKESSIKFLKEMIKEEK